jgi:8-oxo-dGTP pyrophosphatase MutT (NUDIX family)
MKEISAGGVVYRKHQGNIQLLLISDRFGYETLPKGKQEPGETIEQTALREIEEETGIVGKIISPLHVSTYQYQHEQLGMVQKEVTYFLVEAVKGEETPQLSEIHGVRWLDPQTAWQLQWEHGYENNRIVFAKAFQALGLENKVGDSS